MTLSLITTCLNSCITVLIILNHPQNYFCLLSWHCKIVGCLLIFVKTVTQYFVINYYAFKDSHREDNLVLSHTILFIFFKSVICASSKRKMVKIHHGHSPNTYVSIWFPLVVKEKD